MCCHHFKQIGTENVDKVFTVNTVKTTALTLPLCAFNLLHHLLAFTGRSLLFIMSDQQYFRVHKSESKILGVQMSACSVLKYQLQFPEIDYTLLIRVFQCGQRRITERYQKMIEAERHKNCVFIFL